MGLSISCECGRNIHIPSSLPHIIVCLSCGNRFMRMEKAIYKRMKGKAKGVERKEKSLIGFFGTGAGGGG